MSRIVNAFLHDLGAQPDELPVGLQVAVAAVVVFVVIVISTLPA